MMVTVGAAGLVITVGLLTMIELGTKHFHSEAVGNSIAFTTFAFCLVVAALECRIGDRIPSSPPPPSTPSK